VTRTLPLEIYLQRETDADAAVALSLVLVAVAVTVVGLTYRRPGQQGRRSAQPAGAEAAARADQHEGAR
jgi:molybdate transport system permease protein